MSEETEKEVIANLEKLTELFDFPKSDKSVKHKELKTFKNFTNIKELSPLQVKMEWKIHYPVRGDRRFEKPLPLSVKHGNTVVLCDDKKFVEVSSQACLIEIKTINSNKTYHYEALCITYDNPTVVYIYEGNIHVDWEKCLPGLCGLNMGSIRGTVYVHKLSGRHFRFLPYGRHKNRQHFVSVSHEKEICYYSYDRLILKLPSNGSISYINMAVGPNYRYLGHNNKRNKSKCHYYIITSNPMIK